MAVIITIKGIDRTDNVVWDSIKIRNLLTRQIDTCSLIIKEQGTKTFVPRQGSEIVVTDSGTKIFAGIIIRVESVPMALGMIRHNVECADYGWLLDKRLLSKGFARDTVNNIITDIHSTLGLSGDGITLNNVDAPITIDAVNFNYEYVSKILTQLADLISYDWYVDFDKDIHFFNKSANAAAFNLLDTDDSYIYNSLIIRRDLSQIKNSIIVRGGEYEGSQSTFDFELDGDQIVLPLGYKIKDLEATLSGNPLSVGQDSLDNADDFDILHNFQSAILRWKEPDKPSAGAIVKVGGKPILPVIIAAADDVAIAAQASLEGGSGIHEFKIEDRKLQTKRAGIDRANAELNAYATTLSEAEFRTTKSGLRAGQKIRVTSASRSIDEDFIINKVTISSFTKSAFVYDVSLVTTQTFGIIELLQRLVTAGDRRTTINPNELLELVKNANATIQILDTENVSTPTTDSQTIEVADSAVLTFHEPPFKWSNDAGTTPKKLRWDLGEWG